MYADYINSIIFVAFKGIFTYLIRLFFYLVIYSFYVLADSVPHNITLIRRMENAKELANKAVPHNITQLVARSLLP